MPKPENPLRPVILGSTLIVLAIATVPAVANEPTPCLEREAITLSDAWEAAEATSPRLRGVASNRRAAHLEGDAHRRAALPGLAVTLQGDAGQRARPGEERALGPGVRGDAGAIMSWPLFESQRKALGRYLEGLEDEALSLERLEVLEARLEISLSYIEAHTSAEAVDHLVETANSTKALVELVEARVEEEVEAPYALMVIRRHQRALERELLSAQARHKRALIELSTLAGRCVSPEPMGNAPAVEPPSSVPENHPSISARTQRGAALEARAEAIARTGLFDLRALGVASLYASRAFDDYVEPEYYAGLSMTWRPDLSGTRRLQSQAESHRAQAALKEGEGLRRDLQREVDLVAEDLGDLRALLEAVELDQAAAQELERIARLRFEAGAEPLSELIDAHRIHRELAASRIDHLGAIRLLHLRAAVATDSWDSLPRQLGLQGDENP